MSAEHLTGDETLHLRNPLLPVSKLREHRDKRLTDAEKITEAQKQQARREKALALEAEIKAIHQRTNQEIEELASNLLKAERKPNSFNVEVQWKIFNLNKDLPIGERYQLKEVQDMVRKEREDRAVKGLTLPPEEEAAMWAHAQKMLDLKRSGVRPNNRSAAKDAYNVGKKVAVEMKRANQRTGIAGLLAMTRGHMQDIYAPTIYETKNARGFCQKSLGHKLEDVGGRLEAYATTGPQGHRLALDVPSMRKECVSIIAEGLQQLAGKGTSMNYNNYDTGIVAKYGIHLVGWPAHVPFTSPSNLSADHLRDLRAALLSKRCIWQVMSTDEFETHEQRLQAMRAEGQTVGVPRKTRSDKNKKRRRNVENDDENNPDVEVQASVQKKKRTSKAMAKNAPRKSGKGGKAKRAHATQLPPALHKSVEVLGDTSDDDTDE
ncbi:hypothetical protein NP233_g10537 [Leucocoprinus birnbaumii]|uniref:Uncharacterized protein n=1 Tax=Leucocoprinus birnbaumii TaxID=56174 RepID=A0AAD5VIH8_9AGAR|nr:hypothetical protein NP233_g10537 [Leucocoprinus birnbaumii]